jgi:hypothetical protein
MPSIPRLLVIVLAGCGGGGAAQGPGPIEHLGPDEAPPSDGLAVVEINPEQVLDCARHDLAVRVVAGGQVRDELVLEGTCSGVCTEQEKADGEAMVAEIEAGIAAGTHSHSELDYNFTECMFHGVELGRTEQAAGRSIAILVGETPGPHDIPNRYFQIAADVCGKAFLGDSFGSTYANRWSLEDLTVTTEGNDTVVILVEDDQGEHEMYRVRFGPECAVPEEVVGEPPEY